MPNYKDQNNQLHFLDNTEDAEKYLPVGCVEIPDSEAETLRQASIIPPTYQELRAVAYPPMSMYLDAVVKGDEWQKQTYIDECLAIKLKYPKP